MFGLVWLPLSYRVVGERADFGVDLLGYGPVSG